MSLPVVLSAIVVALGVPIADPIIGLIVSISVRPTSLRSGAEDQPTSAHRRWWAWMSKHRAIATQKLNGGREGMEVGRRPSR